MQTRYLLPCSCGQKIAIEPRQAGQSIRCPCGNSVEAPTMLKMTALEPAEPEPTDDMVIAPGVQGELGILPRHAPLITALSEGELRIKRGAEEQIFAIGGGYLEVLDNKVTVLADSAEPSNAADAREATMLMTDVYQGLEGVRPGAVKYLRVMEQVPRPWSAYIDYDRRDASPGQMMAISLYAHLSVKVLHGVVPVREDGSALFTVPADRNIFLEALDEDFMEIQRMRTFVNLRPG